MARTPDADRPTPPSPDRPRGREEHTKPPETFGAVALERHVKDDGRALILYTLRAQPDASGNRGA
jgi:hypothetical protein